MRNIKTFESFANEAKEDLTGKFVELKGDEGSWYEVESDNGNRVEVVAVNTKFRFPPREITNKKFILQVKDSIDESIVNEAKYPYLSELIQLLSDVDAMEMMPAEFEDHLSTELDIDGETAMNLFDAYWSLGAKDRFHFTEKDWVKFLKKQGIK